MTPISRASRHHLLSTKESGSAVLAALAVLAVTLVVVGTALTAAQHGFRTSHHSSRWTQAMHAAEAGAEIGLMTAQKDSWTADGWSGAPGPPGTSAVTLSISLSTGVPATGPISATVAADKVAMAAAEWLRIRSTGSVDLSGGAIAGLDTRDTLLRKLSLRKDRQSGAALGAPRATRTIEVLASPKSPYRRAILLDKKFNMGSGGIIDSFDSSDPAKSTNGLYDLSKRQSNGDVGVNDTQGASDLKDSYVYGSVAYSGPTIQNTDNVQGPVTTPFSRPLVPVRAPVWTTFNPMPSEITSAVTLTGGSSSSPARYKVSKVRLAGGDVLTLAPHAAGQESYVEIWVTGDFTTSGSSYMLQQPGVHVTYHIEGDVKVTGSSFVNQTNIAANNIVNVVTPAVGTPRSVTINGGGDIIGAINAPGSDFTMTGNAQIFGALIGRTLSTGGGQIHYDEALDKFSGTGDYGYSVASWVEAVR